MNEENILLLSAVRALKELAESEGLTLTEVIRVARFVQDDMPVDTGVYVMGYVTSPHYTYSI